MINKQIVDMHFEDIEYLLNKIQDMKKVDDIKNIVDNAQLCLKTLKQYLDTQIKLK